MGKKKSVVLMTIITIVILVLCAIVAFPTFVIPGTGGIKKWNPAIMQNDLGPEFGGGHYAYYYPEGVITEAEYMEDEAENAGKYQKVDGLYLSTDEEDGIIENGEVTENFKAAFNRSVEIITARFAQRAQATDSSYRVSVVDNYAIRVELSATENTKSTSSASYASQAFTQFARFGALTFEAGTEESSTLVDQMNEAKVEEGTDFSINGIIRNVSVKTRYKVAYLHITFTKQGKEMIKAYKDSENTALKLMLGDEALLNISKEVITTKNEVEYGLANEWDKLSAETTCALIQSAMQEGEVYINEISDTAFVLRTPTTSEIATYEPTNDNVFVWVCVAALVALVATCVIPAIKFGGFGAMNIYTNLSYFVITTLCFAFISNGVFAVNFATVLIFLAGLVLINVLNAYIYGAIKKEVSQGKTVQSSVKGGYNKTLSLVADIYVALALGAVALLVGVASLSTFACQALICLVAGAFCTMLWGRVINYMLLSASKDKYKYFRFVREEDEDDE